MRIFSLVCCCLISLFAMDGILIKYYDKSGEEICNTQTKNSYTTQDRKSVSERLLKYNNYCYYQSDNLENYWHKNAPSLATLRTSQLAGCSDAFVSSKSNLDPIGSPLFIDPDDWDKANFTTSITLNQQRSISVVVPKTKDDKCPTTCPLSVNIKVTDYYYNRQYNILGINCDKNANYSDIAGIKESNFGTSYNNSKKGFCEIPLGTYGIYDKLDIEIDYNAKDTPKDERGIILAWKKYGCNLVPIPANYYTYKEPRVQKEYRVVDEVYANMVKNNKKDINWLWRSPIRTKTAGVSNRFCVVASIKNSDGKREQVYPNEAIIRFNYQVLKGEQSQVDGKYIRNRTISFGQNAASGYADRLYRIKTNELFNCFRLGNNMEDMLTPDAFIQVFETINHVVPSDAYNISKGTKNSDNYAVVPAAFRLYFKEQKTQDYENFINKEINPSFEILKESSDDNSTKYNQDKDTLYLRAGRTYTPKIDLLQIDEKNKRYKKIPIHTGAVINYGTYTSVLGKYYKEFNKPFMLPLINDKECEYHADALPSANGVKFNVIDNIANNIQNITYDDVMRYEVSIQDDDWTLVDQPLKNPTQQDKEYIKEYGYQCKGIEIAGLHDVPFYDENLTHCHIKTTSPRYIEFIPDKFQFDFDKVSNQNMTDKNDFTYTGGLDTDKNISKMYASVNFDVTALNLAKQPLKNFTNECYASDLYLKLSYNDDVKSIYQSKKDHFAKNLKLKDDIKFVSDLNISFDERADTYDSQKLVNSYVYHDSNIPIKINKENFTKDIKNVKVGFNYKKDELLPHNPFVVITPEFNIDEVGLGLQHYVMNFYDEYPKNSTQLYKDQHFFKEYKDIFTDTINANVATFLYGNVQAPLHVGPANADGFDGMIYYTFYCSDCNISALPSYTLKTSVPYPGSGTWYINTAHNLIREGHFDNYESQMATNFTYYLESIDAIKSGRQKVKFQNNISGLDTILLDLEKYGFWLRYGANKYKNKIQVKFEDHKSGGWGGYGYDIDGYKDGKTPNVIMQFQEDNAKTKKSKRIQW
ncbi:hypothetical protein LMG7974_00788 [Campylobacter majalis]|uniref:Uncharacterized protein n=1 Tax=Campylobacter majalis TaxID=2790656 RepID=A0ABM8Q4W9_9BACT|nr:hypothetical protein LMG7974_00788 [Campylobacter majalis]